MHQLVAAVQRGKAVSKATIQATQAAEEAATVVEENLGPVATLQEIVRDARRTRDAVGQGWESALAALRRGARAADDEGAPDLYATLFPPVARTVTKSKAPEEQPPPASQTPTAA